MKNTSLPKELAIETTRKLHETLQDYNEFPRYKVQNDIKMLTISLFTINEQLNFKIKNAKPFSTKKLNASV